MDKLPASFALVLSVFAQVMIGVFVKFLTQSDLQIWSQILLRNAFAGLFALLVVPSAVRSFLNLNSNDKFQVGIRSAFYVCAIYFFTLALELTSISNEIFIAAFPFVAVLGWVLFKDPISQMQILFLAIAAIGVIIISGVDFSSFRFGEGELYAFISTGFFALMYLWSRKIKDSFSTHEFSAMTQIITLPPIFVLSLLNSGSINVLQGIDSNALWLALGAAVFITANIFLVSSGITRTSSATANLWLLSAPFFAVVASIVFFSYTPTVREFFGGGIIVCSGALFVIFEMYRDRSLTKSYIND